MGRLISSPTISPLAKRTPPWRSSGGPFDRALSPCGKIASPHAEKVLCSANGSPIMFTSSRSRTPPGARSPVQTHSMAKEPGDSALHLRSDLERT